MNKRNLPLRYFGLFIFSLGVILNVLMIINEAWPTFLFVIICFIGIFQIAISFYKRNVRISWQFFFGIVPFALGYIYLEINSPSKDIFLIPENYRGEVVIDFGIENGADKESDGISRLYRIPSNGHLRTQYELKGESIDIGNTKYLYVDKNGTKEKLFVYCENCEDKDTISLQIISVRLWGENNKDHLSFFVDIPNSKYFKAKQINGS